jgi:hypothetical protein
MFLNSFVNTTLIWVAGPDCLEVLDFSYMHIFPNDFDSRSLHGDEVSLLQNIFIRH